MICRENDNYSILQLYDLYGKNIKLAPPTRRHWANGIDYTTDKERKSNYVSLFSFFSEIILIFVIKMLFLLFHCFIFCRNHLFIPR